MGRPEYKVPWDKVLKPEEQGIKEHANRWAANNVAGEPKAGAAGTKETMIAEGVTSGKGFFAIRSFDAASSRSALGNNVEVDVK